MDVELYVYDLSQGMARQYSLMLTGVQIDAIYHTAVVFGDVEYFFGQGVHRKVPGSTHHGRPMKVVKMGKTDLPPDVIEEYVQSLMQIYTAESYDLFLHNCNNFSQDLCMFLVGKNIPDEIRNLPETFLKTPIGQMLRGQLDQSMRQMTQAPDAVAGQNVPAVPGASAEAAKRYNSPQDRTRAALECNPATFRNGKYVEAPSGHVFYPKSLAELDRLLKQAESSCACIFFTSATCPPCKLVYPTYDQLAEEARDKIVLIKVDVSQVHDIAARYQIRATPTFMTFLEGKKDIEWRGADPNELKGNIRLLINMAHPRHPHVELRTPSLHRKIEQPVMYTRVPPMAKLIGKIGESAQDKAVQELANYITSREENGTVNTPLPDLNAFCDWACSTLPQLSIETRFAGIDLIRIAAVDNRVSSFLATEHELRTLSVVCPETTDFSRVPYSLQSVTLQLFCNLFGSGVFQEMVQHQVVNVRKLLEKLASECLLAQNNKVRSLAAALVFNIAAYDHNERTSGRPDQVDVSSMSDLEAALIQAVVDEEQDKDTLHSLLMALGLLLYGAPSESSIWDLCTAMEVRESLKQKSRKAALRNEPLLREIGDELLANADKR